MSLPIDGLNGCLKLWLASRRWNSGHINLSLGAVKSVWYRSVDYVQMGPKLPIVPKYAHLEASSVSSLTRMGDVLPQLFSPEVLWVSSRSAVQKAELKPYQLAQARLAGFKVPRTLYTTAPEEALRFVRDESVCAIKPLAPSPPEHLGQPTRVLRYEQGLDLNGVSVQAHIFQELIDPAYEVRAAVVGTEAFAAKVWDSNQQEAIAEGIRDYRRAIETDTFKTASHTLPSQVAKACVQYVKLMGLVSGYFDLIVDKSGQYWFLECNPNGQWAFVDDQTVENIGRALARLLESGKSPWPVE